MCSSAPPAEATLRWTPISYLPVRDASSGHRFAFGPRIDLAWRAESLALSAKCHEYLLGCANYRRLFSLPSGGDPAAKRSTARETPQGIRAGGISALWNRGDRRPGQLLPPADRTQL